ncbi:MAG: peptide chain release factor aRF-1 [Nitrososphaerales archaeon]
MQFKKQLQHLETLRGNGTSLITLIIPPKKEIHQVNTILVQEYGTAGNIKSRVNRLSVLSAITSAQQKLKLYSSIPSHGLCLLVGTISEGDNISRQVAYDFEPLKPLKQFIYMCDARFHLESLLDQLHDEKTFGFVVVNGDELLLAKISGDSQTIMHHEKVTLPKKHGRGGQSAARFERHRTEAIHNYLRKVSEAMVRCFISDDLPNVVGLILAGSADLKTELSRSDLFDPRLHQRILKLVDTSYGGKAGLQEAINASSEILQELDYLQEKKVLQQFFDLIAKGSSRILYGKETFSALEQGLLEVLYLHPEDPHFEELVTLAKDRGTGIAAITGNTSEGNQFLKGFGGLGGIARYDLPAFEEEVEWLDENAED